MMEARTEDLSWSCVRTIFSVPRGTAGKATARNSSAIWTIGWKDSGTGKVLVYDRKITEYFHLEEKEYVYQDLIRQIDAQMTPEMLQDICGNCSWYPVSACRKNILG